MFAVFTISGAAHRFYPLAAKVVDLDYRQDFVTMEDGAGNLWGFWGCEDWERGDLAAMIMDSHGTGNIDDDEIVTIRYAGRFF